MKKLLLLALLFCSCGGPHIAGECPETANKPCLTGKVCTHDPVKGCEMCYCNSADTRNALEEDPNVQGRDPSMPP